MARCITVALSTDLSNVSNKDAVQQAYDLIYEYGCMKWNFEVAIEVDKKPVFHIAYDKLDFDDSIFTDLVEDGCNPADARETAESQYDVAIHNITDDTWADGGYRDTQLHVSDLYTAFRDVLDELKKQKEEKLYWGVLIESCKAHGGISAQLEHVPHKATEQPAMEIFEDEYYQYKRRWFESFEEAEAEVDKIRGLEITVERVRNSVTQGEAKVYINGEFFTNFGDEIVMMKDGGDYYGSNIGGWVSNKPDSSFVLGTIWHPMDYMYHFEDKLNKLLQKEEPER